MTAEELRSYNPASRLGQNSDPARWQRAMDVARAAAKLLKERFGATRVVAFGSLAHPDWFGPWSDIDLAAWGIRPRSFCTAVALVTGLSSEFEADLVDIEGCGPSLRQSIERDGVDL